MRDLIERERRRERRTGRERRAPTEWSWAAVTEEDRLADPRRVPRQDMLSGHQRMVLERGLAHGTPVPVHPDAPRPGEELVGTRDPRFLSDPGRRPGPQDLQAWGAPYSRGALVNRDMVGTWGNRGPLRAAGAHPFEDVARLEARGPRNWKRPDVRIIEDINDFLSDQIEIDASDVTVDAQDGTVILTGVVPDRMSKHWVEECALDVRGVKDVRNQLRVRQHQG